MSRRTILTTVALVGLGVPLARAGGAALEEAKLVPLDGIAGQEFGDAVAVDGDTLVVGAIRDDDAGTWAGAAYVFVRAAGVWSEQAKLVPADLSSGDFFGDAVALHGETLVVGAPGQDSTAQNAGAAYAYVRQGTTWTQQAKLVASGSAAQAFGAAAAIDGDTLVVGAKNEDAPKKNSGAAYVFTRGGTIWSEQAVLLASDADEDDFFGWSVAVDGDAAIVGAYMDVFETGKAYTYARSGTTWTEEAVLVASDAEIGAHFGGAVAIDGATAVVGAYFASPSGVIQAGSAYVFTRQGTAWTEQAQLVATDGATTDRFGNAVALEGDTILVGAFQDDHPGRIDAGSAYVFARGGTTWTELHKLVVDDGQTGDRFGNSVDLSGTAMAFGAPLDDEAAGLDSGSAYVFRQVAFEGYCTSGTSTSGCNAALSASGTASASATSGFVLMAADVEGDRNGVFFFGTNGRQANPWGNGTSLQCVVPPVKRGGPLLGTGASGPQCEGAFSQDLNALWCQSCPKPGHNPGTGAVVQAQLLYRDPFSTSNKTTSLSDAIEFVVAP